MSEYKAYIRAGTSVMLNLPEQDIAITHGLKKWDGYVLRVTKVVPISKQATRYFELEGCVSEKGVPYGIDPDWCDKTSVQGYGGFKP